MSASFLDGLVQARGDLIALQAHIDDPGVAERLELAAAHLLAAWRVARRGGVEERSDCVEATHQAVRAHFRLVARMELEGDA